MKKKLNLWFAAQLSVLIGSIFGAIVAGLFCIYWLGLFSFMGIIFVATLFRVRGIDCLFEEEYSDVEVEQIKELMKSKGFTFQDANALVTQQPTKEQKI